MATDHDSIDHAHAASRHPAVQKPDARGRLSWQRPAAAPPPPLWKVLLLALGVLAALFVISQLNDWRAAERLKHIRQQIRQNVITLATAAAQYMQQHNVRQVKERELVGPGKLLPKAPPSVIGETYDHLEFSLDDPDVDVHEPSSKWLDFDIHWHKVGTPDFISQPHPYSAEDSPASNVEF